MDKVTKVILTICVILLIVLIVSPFFLSNKSINGNVVDEGNKQTIKIGVIAPLSGDSAFLGEGVKNAVLLAQKNLPKDTKYNYEVIFEDDMLRSTETSKAANKLISVNEIDAVVSFSSGSGNVVAPLANENKIVHISVASDANIAKGEYNFLHWTPPEEEARVFVEELQRRDIKRVAMITLNQQGIKATVDAVKEQIKGTDIKIVDEETFNTGEKDFKTILLKAKQTNPEIYYFTAFSPELELIAKQKQELGITTPVTSIEGFEFTEQPNLFEGMWYINSADPTAKYTKDYFREYGKNPPFASGNAYDSYNLIVNAYEKTDNSAKEKPTAQEAAKEILQIKNFEGALGTLSISSDHIVFSEAVVRQIKDSTFVTIRN